MASVVVLAEAKVESVAQVLDSENISLSQSEDIPHTLLYRKASVLTVS